MSKLIVTAGPYRFDAKLELEAAPKTCAAFLAHLPFISRIVHVRWSGEGVWMPLGDLDFGVGYENNTSYPAPGQIILYPGGVSETEILLSYGPVQFASKAGPTLGQPLPDPDLGAGEPPHLGRKTLYEGAQDIRFDLAG